MNDKNLDDKFRKALLFYHTGQLATVTLWLIGKKYLVMKFMKLIYEDLVKKSEKNIRNIFSYCELDWNDSLLSHLHNKRPVHTASVMQVRKPIYKTSIERFRNYTQLTNELLTIPDFESLVSAYDA